jgi:hypothetical protein
MVDRADIQFIQSPESRDRHRHGWTQSFAKLERLFL